LRGLRSRRLFVNSSHAIHKRSARSREDFGRFVLSDAKTRFYEVELTPNTSLPSNGPNHIASIEGCAVQEISRNARFCITQRDARLRGPIVRDQICKPVSVYVSKVVLKYARLGEIV